MYRDKFSHAVVPSIFKVFDRITLEVHAWGRSLAVACSAPNLWTWVQYPVLTCYTDVSCCATSVANLINVVSGGRLGTYLH